MEKGEGNEKEKSQKSSVCKSCSRILRISVAARCRCGAYYHNSCAAKFQTNTPGVYRCCHCSRRVQAYSGAISRRTGPAQVVS